MSIVRVAIPLAKGKRRFHIDKGRPWSIAEHAMLAAVASRPRSVVELAAIADLPRRLILEMLIRLMRAGWVTLQQNSRGIIFTASRAGSSVVDLDELPSVLKRTRRWMNFVIDKVTGTLYRSRELFFYEPHVVRKFAERERLVWIEERPLQGNDEPAALVSTLLAEDERFVGVDPTGERLVDRYALVTVRNGEIDGLPERAPEELRRLVLDAANSAPATPAGSASPSFRPTPRPPHEQERPSPIRVAFQLDDLILGGREHKEIFDAMLRRARRRIVIHSTFISDVGFAGALPLLHDAVQGGATVDILWGEDDEKSGSKSTSTLVRRLRAEMDSRGYSNAIRIHPFSTRSHAKILIADDGTSSRLTAVVGSCNWLSSNFQSFEASVRLRDAAMVSIVLDQLAQLSLGRDGHWTELTNLMAAMASDARRQKSPAVGRAEMAVILGPQHAQFVLLARDSVQKRLFVTSHRLGAATRPAIVVPAIAAAQAGNIDAKVYFGVTTGAIGPDDASRIAIAAGEAGVQIRPVVEPKLHAKILAWDDDYVLITSQNWLSADPSEANLRREIGIYVHAAGASRTVIDRFEILRRD